MTHVLPIEQRMWAKTARVKPPFLTDAQIDAKYDMKSERILTETNREKLPNFYESLAKPDYMNTRPFYQRRQRWDAKRQSLLIESILINIPIPPLFVYEVRPNVHEVMDGQQRISAIKAFYSNELVLEGLERWPELNGRTYSKLPKGIRAGIDRRSISWISVLSESTDSDEDAFMLKQLVFERLNTGGVDLSHQEIRNALFAGDFNDLLLSLSRVAAHRKAWGLPEFSDVELRATPEYLAKLPLYREMDDVEVILRFFALRNAQHYQRGMRGFLDLYMMKSRQFSPTDLESLRDLYTDTIQLAVDVYGDLVFKAYDVKTGSWGTKSQKAFADAVLVGLANNLTSAEQLRAKRAKVQKRTQQLFEADTAGVLVGRGNTKKDVEDRIKLTTDMFREVGQ